MKCVRVAIAGFGNIGREAARRLLSRRERYCELYQADVRLVAVCGSKTGALDVEGLELPALDQLQAGLTGPELIASSQADVLIEAGPSDFRSGGPGLAYIRDALERGLDVVAVSKGALVFDGPQLKALAKSSGSHLKISGATAAALPTIDLLHHSLLGCNVIRVEGILNATTNYLLHAMTSRGVGFDQALSEAQAGGFAERDPRNDVEGWDTASKLLLLANFGLGASLSIQDFQVQGIQDIGEDQIQAWKAQGLTPKLVGSLVREDDTWRGEIRVKTFPSDDPFALVGGKTKAIRILTDAMGEVMAVAGGLEPAATASAALKDLEHILAARVG
ncbi:hypothetical protein LTR94_024118 [Friedmanniomyces endolithicus]|nr:hypothetical protein LTR94_024118 [Friedmanniomyces endolithicus]